MPDAADTPSPGISQHLEALLRTRKAKSPLKEIVGRIELSGGLAPVVFILTLPVLLPLPPGMSMILALPLLAAAPQMLWGRKSLWMPPFLARQTLDRDKLHALVRKALPWVQRLEKVVKPRLTFLTGRIGQGVAGLVCTAMAVLLVLPIPFANLFPALTVCVFCLGLTRRDGLLILGGCLTMILAVVAIVWGAHGVRLGVHALKALI